jgi:hypothetical protein
MALPRSEIIHGDLVPRKRHSENVTGQCLYANHILAIRAGPLPAGASTASRCC